VTLLSPARVQPVPAVGGRRAVTLLSGFLGSGKTTLLRTELDHVGVSSPAVILNDFGTTMVDDVLLTGDGHAPVVISGGCACCTRRDDLARALSGLLDAEQRGATPRRDHVVIETSGLSDPGPIAFTIANDPVLKHHYALARVCVTLDAVTGAGAVEHHEVALRQLLAADDVLITKADLVAPEQVDGLVRWVHSLNPSATVGVTAHGELLREERPTAPGACPRDHDARAGDRRTAGLAGLLDLAQPPPASARRRRAPGQGRPGCPRHRTGRRQRGAARRAPPRAPLRTGPTRHPAGPHRP
jgi:G3E family GTPase